ELNRRVRHSDRDQHDASAGARMTATVQRLDGLRCVASGGCILRRRCVGASGYRPPATPLYWPPARSGSATSPVVVAPQFAAAAGAADGPATRDAGTANSTLMTTVAAGDFIASACSEPVRRV